MKEEDREQYQRIFADTIEAYQKMFQLVENKLHLRRTEQQALAFVIEDMRKENPETWREEFERFLTELRGIEDIPALSWRLAQEVNKRYNVHVYKRHLAEQVEPRKKNLQLLKQSISDDMSARQEAYDLGQRVPIGGVILEHVPLWFQFVAAD